MSEYVGSRIVPKPCGEWDKTKEYEVLSVVLLPSSGDSYIARKDTPAGTDIGDEEYWMLCSEFSAQLAALETHLTEAESAMDEKLADAVSEMEDARDEMSAAVEKLTEQIAENVSASTDSDADYAAEVVDARVDADGETHTSMGEAVRSIAPKLRSELQDSYGTLFNTEMSGYGGALFAPGPEYLNGETISYNHYTTSTFSGWTAMFEMPESMLVTSLTFYIHARSEDEDKGGNSVTQVRAAIAVDERNEDNDVFNETIYTSIAPGDSEAVTFTVPGVYLKAGRTVYILVEADAVCTIAFGSGLASAAGVSWYATEGKTTLMENMIAAVNTSSRIYVELGGYYIDRNAAALVQEALDSAVETLQAEIDDDEARITSLEKRADEDEAAFADMQESFQQEETTNILEDLLPVNSASLLYNTSTFTGWAAPVGPLQNFNALTFSIYNRNSSDENGNDEPITTIRCIVTVEDKEGETLVDETHTDLELAAGEKHEILFQFSKVIKNEEGVNLYVAFACDQHIGVYAGSTGASLLDSGYGRAAYLAVTGDTPYSVTKDLSSWLYVSTTTNAVKMDVQAVWIGYRYFLGEEQQSQVAEIADERCEALRETMESEGLFTVAPRVILPDRFQAVVGDTLQLFYRGVVEHPYPYVFNIEVKCSIGKNTARYFEVTPTADQVGNYTLTVNVRNSEDTIITTATSTLEVVAVGDAPASNVNVLCIGDSLTSGGYWCAEAYRRLTAEDGSPTGLGLSNITFIGTKTNGGAGYEGYGGWTWASYLAEPSSTTLDMWVYCTHDKDSSDQHSLWEDENGNLWQMETIQTDKIKFTRYNSHTGEMPVGAGTLTHYSNADHTEDISYTETAAADGNPFWDNDSGSVSFSDYCNRNGFEGIDYVYTLLTWNGLGGYYATADSTAIAKHVANAKTLLRILHVDYPEAKVKMMGIQMPSLNGGCGANYGANGGYSNWYGLCRTVMGMNLAYQEMANDEEFSDYVEFINISAQFDSENNMPQTSKAVNTRSSTTEMIGTNGVHPSTNGYYQIGDAAYRNMVARITG